MAQLVRAPPCHGGGRGFESPLGRKNELKFVKKKLKKDIDTYQNVC